MTLKTYEIPYNDDSKTWEPVLIKSRVINRGDKKIFKIYPGGARIEDNPDSTYLAFGNNVLLIESTEIEPQIEAGDVAKFKLRLNDSGPGLIEILKKNSRFKLKVVLTPQLDDESGKPKPGPDVEGYTEVVAQLPHTWDLTFRKTLWHDGGVIDLKKVEGAPLAQLQTLGDWGGRLLLKPKGQFTPDNGDKITSNKLVAHAGECVLDIGDDELIKGEWDAAAEAYIFKIPPSKEGEAPTGQAGQDVTVTPFLELQISWQRQLKTLLTAAAKLGNTMHPEIRQLARIYVTGIMDYLAEKEEQTLVDRKRELSTWLLNTSHFVEFMGRASDMFRKSLALFDEAHKRYVDNLVNALIEAIFAVFDILDYVFKSAANTAKTALKSSTKEMVEEVAEQSAKELAQQKTVIMQAVDVDKQLRERLDTQLAELGRRYQRMQASAAPDATDYIDDFLQQSRALQAQRKAVQARLQAQGRELANLECNRLIAQEVKENAAQATEKEFLEQIKRRAANLGDAPEIRKLVGDLDELVRQDTGFLMNMNRQVQQMLADLPANAPAASRQGLERLSGALVQQIEALQTNTLIDFNKNIYADMLEKGPLGNRLKKVNEEGQRAKKAAEAIRYQNVAWEHYKGFFSPLWWFMDWSLAQILWLHDLAREWIPGLARAEAMLAFAVDTILGYVMRMLNAIIDFTNSHHWKRSTISSSVRGRGKQKVMSCGVSSAFFSFPSSTNQLADKLRPRTLVANSPNGSAASKQAAKQQLLSFANGGYQREKSTQQQQAKTAFVSLCRQALDASRLDEAAPEHINASSFRQVWGSLAGPMVQYEEAFKATGAQATDYLWSIGRFQEASTFQDWDGAIEWIAWAVAWGLRLGGILLIFTGVGAAAVPAAFAAAQFSEWLAAALRPAISALGTMPDIIAFQYDVVIAAALAFEAATVGGVDLDNMIGPSEFIE